MRKKGAGSLTFIAGLVIGAWGGYKLARRVPAEPRMPHLDDWQRELEIERGAREAALLACLMQQRYEQLYAARPRYDHAALRGHLEQNLLPGLAMYQVLLEESGDEVFALDQAEWLMSLTADRMRKLVSIARRLPRSFWVVRAIGRLILRFGFPAQGFELRVVRDDETAFAFDIHRCFYLDVLTQYGAPELTPVFCKLDDLIYQQLPPWIRWERTGTLGRGDECCDFRFSHVPGALELGSGASSEWQA